MPYSDHKKTYWRNNLTVGVSAWNHYWHMRCTSSKQLVTSIAANWLTDTFYPAHLWQLTKRSGKWYCQGDKINSEAGTRMVFWQRSLGAFSIKSYRHDLQALPENCQDLSGGHRLLSTNSDYLSTGNRNRSRTKQMSQSVRFLVGQEGKWNHLKHS